MELELVKCRYCGGETLAGSVYCCRCGERLARKRKEKSEERTARKWAKPRIRKDGVAVGRIMIDGERVTVEGRDEADYYAKADAIAAGIIEAKQRGPRMTLGEAIDRYIEERDLSPETVRGYKITKKRYAALMQTEIGKIRAEDIRDAIRGERKRYRIPKARQIGDKWGAVVDGERIQADTPEDYERMAQERKRELHGAGLSPKAMKNDKGLLSTVIHAMTGERLEVSTPKVIRGEHLFLEPEQIRVFCDAIRGEAVEIPALLALSSLRRSELMHLDWTAVDLDGRQIRVAGADVYDEHNKRVSKDENKNDSSRRVVPIMMDQLRDALDAVPVKAGRVVRCAPDTVRRRVNAICRAHGLPEIGTHGLRHSFASLAAHLQMPRAIAQEIGGWKNDRIMEEIYTHVAQTDRERFKNDMAKWYNYRKITKEGEKTQAESGV